jgi:hypothetical protein
MNDREALAAAFYQAKAHPTAQWANLDWRGREPYYSDADIALAWMVKHDARIRREVVTSERAHRAALVEASRGSGDA